MRKLLVYLTLILLCGCSNQASEHIALKQGFQKKSIKTSKFTLASLQRINKTNAPVYVYIEGDGRVASHRQYISKDPTPQNSIVMRFAASDLNSNVVYLARPCQYAKQDLQTVCEAKHWTNARYSSEIVDAMNQALDNIKANSNATQIHLIGYSGGGTIAVLLAAQRNDIASLRTIAGNLDLQAMQQYHKTAPLDESLDPLHVASKVHNIPQIHFIGKDDIVVPEHTTKNFRELAQLRKEQIVVLKGVGHRDGWVDKWPVLLKQVP